VMLQIVVEVAGTVCDADCSIFSQTVNRQRTAVSDAYFRREPPIRATCVTGAANLASAICYMAARRQSLASQAEAPLMGPARARGLETIALDVCARTYRHLASTACDVDSAFPRGALCNSIAIVRTGLGGVARTVCPAIACVPYPCCTFVWRSG